MCNRDVPEVDPDAPLDDGDMASLGAVRELYELTDPVPADLTERIKFAMALEADIDFEVAVLAERERSTSSSMATVRSAGSTSEITTITFTCDALSVMVALRPAGDGLIRVDGWVEPEGEYRIELRAKDSNFALTSDSGGRFVVPEVPNSMFQLVLRPHPELVRDGAAAVVVTPTVEL